MKNINDELTVSEDIWKKFKEAGDRFYDMKRNFFDELGNDRKTNVPAKEKIIARHIEMTAIDTDDPENSKALGEEVLSLQERWKEIGPVPQHVSRQIYNRCLEALNAFYDKRSTFFSGKI